MNPNEYNRLLSHRLRGFDDLDSTKLGLKRALIAGVQNCEFDVRFTRDGNPIAYHDPLFKSDDGSWEYIDAWELNALRAQHTFSRLATLDDMLSCFAEYKGSRALLHLDVKVGGKEEVVYETVARFGLLNDVVLVSWLPGVLMRFHQLSPQTRLCLSHFAIARPLYGFIKALSPLINHIPDDFGRTLRNSGYQFVREASTATLYAHDNGDPLSGDFSDDGERHNVCHMVSGLLSGRMLDLLSRTVGIVCLPVAQATRRLRDSYQSHNIQVAVYAVRTQTSLDSVIRRINPDFVYVDRSDLFPNAPQVVDVS